MGEIKELEEAIAQIDKAIRESVFFTTETYGDVTLEQMHIDMTKAHDQILNLKGDGWKMAIVSDWSYTNPDGNKYAQVIWQAGE